MSLRSDEESRSSEHIRPRRAFAIVPAAGESRRMGTAKLLLPWAGATVIESTLRAWRESSVDAVVVVVSPINKPLANVCRATGANVVVPKVPPADMKVSIQAALQALQQTYAPADDDCFLVAPADMPWIEPATIDRLIREMLNSSANVIVPTHAGRRGHPIAVSWSLANKVLCLGDEESLKTIVDHNRVREIECDMTILGDLDTPADYERALAKYKNR
jgi:molybdenum cofactor cytidylyltransferase